MRKMPGNAPGIFFSGKEPDDPEEPTAPRPNPADRKTPES
jgi:hypothetical protein